MEDNQLGQNINNLKFFLVDRALGNFIQIYKELFYDHINKKASPLSLEARGLLTTMLTLKGLDWHFTVKGMAAICKCTTGKISRILKELKKYGYINEVDRPRTATGEYTGKIYEVYESTDKSLIVEYPYPENADSENPLMENKAQYNINSNRRNKQIKDLKKSNKAGTSSCNMSTKSSFSSIPSSLHDSCNHDTCEHDSCIHDSTDTSTFREELTKHDSHGVSQNQQVNTAVGAAATDGASKADAKTSGRKRQEKKIHEQIDIEYTESPLKEPFKDLISALTQNGRCVTDVLYQKLKEDLTTYDNDDERLEAIDIGSRYGSIDLKYNLKESKRKTTKKKTVVKDINGKEPLKQKGADWHRDENGKIVWN